MIKQTLGLLLTVLAVCSVTFTIQTIRPVTGQIIIPQTGELDQ